MPQVHAIYHNTDSNTGTVTRQIETGLNAEERVLGSFVLPMESVRRNLPVLADFLDKLEDDGFNAYSCAEVQALAKLLDSVPNPDYQKITFICPDSNGGMEFWNPCQSCQLWLIEVGKWGLGKQYRLSDGILQILQPHQTNNPFFDLQNRTLFPPLPNSC